ncbi:MAG TPA: hypothetical protein VHE81_20175 [Lacipirellulaceae bacterium]|nr:hypothetical protein [Lacipirellulaceae bacterium]
MFGDTFVDALAAMHPDEWRLLVFSSPVRWALLCDPAFDPRSELAKLVETGSCDVPREWFPEAPLAIASGLIERILDDDVDAYRAVWLVVSFVQSLKSDAATLRSVEWWRPQWWRPQM